MPKKGPRPIVGVQLPISSGTKRSSTAFNKNVWIAAAKAVGADAFAEKILKEKDWRWNYMPYIAESMRVGSKPEDTMKMAEAAWKYVYENIEYYPEVGAKPITLLQAMDYPNKNAAFETGTLGGSGKLEKEFFLPFEGKTLRGAAAAKQIKDWTAGGVIEADTAEALLPMCESSDFIKNLGNKVFVLLGGLSEMGPLQRLLSWGATVVALDFHAPPLQERLMKIANEYGGTLIVPLKPGTMNLDKSQWAKNAGCDLLKDFPEVADWLVNLLPEKEMIIGSFCYLDGERFIKIVSTMDAIASTVVQKRSTKTSLCYYATPTDCHLVMPEAVTASKSQSHSGLAGILASILCKPGYSSKDVVGDIPFTNSLVPRQGPNYALAKRLQTWRAVNFRKNGVTVSLNVAPTTKTVSVMKNKIFAFTMAGMLAFKPMYPFDTETTKSVMTGLLINDICNSKSSANPNANLDHPLQLLQKTQVHGGMYRTGLLFDSMGTPAVLIAAIQKYWWALLLVFILLGYLVL